ncbi:MAG: DUF1624 domain-containing protein [Lachnospiraceae bacterium]|nr:DUF1624 domain-containing protein [Lachnospiraceae bacterium]
MKRERLPFLDALRGLTIISMVAYHGMYDLVELYGVHAEWYWETPGYVWQQSICWTFILLSGFCWSLGSRPLRRGLLVSVCGLVVTAVTGVFMPSELIIFGILTFTGAAMLVLIPLSGLLEKIPAGWGLAASALLFFLTRNVNTGYWGFEQITLGRVPDGLYRNLITTFLGFQAPGFYSSDYFSLFPWLFLYLCGYFLYRLLGSRRSVLHLLRRRGGFLETIGRHSLPIYMLHQIVLMAVFMVAVWIGLL